MHVRLSFEGQHLRSKDPLPIHGTDARSQSIDECTSLPRLLNVPITEARDKSLPLHLFSEMGHMLNWTQHIANFLSCCC